MYHRIPTSGGGMYLEGVTVCVNYADFLEETLCRNLDHFDEFAVVTACDDKATQAVCERHGVICVKSDMHREDPLDRFNKGLMINLGLAHLRNRGWLLHLDADIVLPDRLRFVLNKSRLDEDCLYGADRMNVVGRANWEKLKQSSAYQRQYHHRYLVCPAAARLGSRLLHNEYGYCPIGYFQLWHSRQRKRYHFSQGSAEHSDVLFALQWPAARRILLPGVFVYHLESEPARIGANWGGRVTRPFAK